MILLILRVGMGDGLWGAPLLTLLAGEFPRRWDEIQQHAEVQIIVTALGLPVGTMMFLKSAMKSKSKDSKEE
jgi:hypothetical protein